LSHTPSHPLPHLLIVSHHTMSTVPDSSSAPTDAPAPAAPGLPDYLLDSDAVLKDTATWRNGRAPDYKRMRADYEEGKSVDHKPGTFPFFVNNLVKKRVFWPRQSETRY
jgi:hypothetical protein